MVGLKPLTPEALYRCCESERLTFESTDDLDDLDELLGQDRAIAAIRFAIGIRHDGYNVYALGPNGTGRHEFVRRFLSSHIKDKPTPSDWCYVHNFDEQESPRAIELPPGRASELSDAMDQLIEDLKVTIPSAFESEDYEVRRNAINEALKERQQEAFGEIQKVAEEKDLAIMRTPTGLILLPKIDGEVLSPEAFEELPEETRAEVEVEIEALQETLQLSMRKAPKWEKQRREEIRDLNREVTTFAVEQPIQALKEQFDSQDDILEFLSAVEKDVVENVDNFFESAHQVRAGNDEAPNPQVMLRSAMREADVFRRYSVNVLVGNADAEGAPFVYEDNPTMANLVGRVDHRSVFGMLTTDHSLIRPGALHRANSGYLMLDAIKLLQTPMAWQELKRALRAKEIRIGSPGQMLGVASAASLDPEPIPLDVRVVLVGERRIYYELNELDPEFSQLFKVPADFTMSMDRDEEAFEKVARQIATKVREEKLRPFSRDAIARIIEHRARVAEDAEKLSTHMESLIALIRESDYWASEADHERVERSDVQTAIDQDIYRQSRVRDRTLEEIQRNTYKIDTEGEKVGQINGLSVMQIGQFSFGRPNRITAKVRLGKGDVVDIEREVNLGGPIHSKGVLILTGFLGAKYAKLQPLALSATLVFEQSYGGVDGDSASTAELCALLSAIAEIPIRQDCAVTGSVNQNGEVQAVGGVNDKIEGFFSVCEERTLTGEQAVILPASNAKHLMLRNNVVSAARKGQFKVYAVETVDEAIELLTGWDAGVADEDGVFPEGTFNRRVADKLAEMADVAKRLSRESRSKDDTE